MVNPLVWVVYAALTIALNIEARDAGLFLFPFLMPKQQFEILEDTRAAD